jgi:hypothetical protein
MEKNKTIIIVVAVAMVVVVAAYIVFKQLSKSDDYTREAGRTIDKNDLSYDNLTYQNLAEAIFDEMDGPGTDEAGILSILGQLNTKSDWLKLVEAFGVRENTDWLDPFEGGNLMQWLISEHDSGELDEIRSLLSKIGVTL